MNFRGECKTCVFGGRARKGWPPSTEPARGGLQLEPWRAPGSQSQVRDGNAYGLLLRQRTTRGGFLGVCAGTSRGTPTMIGATTLNSAGRSSSSRVC